MRKNKFFVSDCFSSSGYIKEGKKSHLETHQNFRRTCYINNPHWQSGGIITFLCKYYIVISDALVDSFLYVLFSLLAAILSGLHEKPRRNKDWVTEKVQRKVSANDITFLIARPLFYVTFCCFLRLLTPVTYLLERCIILLWVVFCEMI